MAKKSTTRDDNEGQEPPGFEACIEELELIVRRLEEGGGALESALADYSKAIQLMRHCHASLEQAERKIEMLSGVDANGNPIVQTLADESQSMEEKRQSRGDKRSAASGKPASKRSDDLGGLF